jgi:hypothetical protein
LLVIQFHIEPAPANRDSMLNGGTALQIQVRITPFGQFNNLLFISEGQALAERGPQVALKEGGVPSFAVLK